MDLTEYLAPERVVLLAGTGKAEALERLVEAIAPAAEGVSPEQIAQAVWKRERLMSTGIGQGVAIPHVRLPGLSEAVMAVGVSREGLADYPSLDGQPVHILVLIAAPQGQHDKYIRLLAMAAEVFKRGDLREAILRAEAPAEVYRIFTGGAR